MSLSNMLVSAEERAAAAPFSFELLPRRDRETLKPGDYAMCLFTLPDGVATRRIDVSPWAHSTPPTGERMWVRVKERADDRYVGTLANQPVVVQGTFGDTVHFGPEHVLSIRLVD